MRVYLVGQHRNEYPEGNVWEWQGVFSTEEKARAACRNWRYFYTPLELDENAPDESVMVDVTFPIIPPEEVVNE